MKDQKGQKSNTVTGAVEFAAAPVAGNSPPILQDLTFSPSVATSGTPVSLVGSVFATDLDSNWASIHYRFRRPNGTTLPEAKVTVSGLSGKTSGSIAFTRPVRPDAAGVWQLQVYAKDAAGAASATIAGDFTVAALAVPSETAPSIVKLTVQPLTVIIDKEKTFTGSVQLTDADGKADFSTIALVDPTGAPLPETAITLDGFDGDTAFTAEFTMPFTAEIVGDYTLEAWVTDLEGQESAIAAATVVAFDLSNVNSACAALETDCTGQGFCYDVNSTTCAYLAEK